MSTNTQGTELEKIFHEPNRLAIMSALCAAEDGMSFPELREACNLTDGNLNRHLKVLTESGAIRSKKQFVDERPRTTVKLSPSGLKRFQEYLKALEAVLLNARNALATTPETQRDISPAAAKANATA